MTGPFEESAMLGEMIRPTRLLVDVSPALMPVQPRGHPELMLAAIAITAQTFGGL